MSQYCELLGLHWPIAALPRRHSMSRKCRMQSSILSKAACFSLSGVGVQVCKGVCCRGLHKYGKLMS